VIKLANNMPTKSMILYLQKRNYILLQ